MHIATSPDHLSGISCYNAPINGAYHPIPFPRGANPIQFLIAAWHLKKLVKKIQPDLIHAHFFSSFFTLSLITVNKFPTTLGTYHGLNSPLTSGWKKIIFQILEKFTINRSSLTWLLNNEDYLYLNKNRKVYVHSTLGIGCDIKKFEPERIDQISLNKLKLKLKLNDSFVFIFIGRQVEHKGFALVARSFLRIQSKTNKCKLLLLGVKDSIHPTGLSHKDEELLFSLSSVIQVGWQTNVQDYLSLSNVMVFPSYREGVPVCLMEALSMGVPVITSNSRGCRDVVRNKVDGLILDDDSTDSIYNAMMRLMNNSVEYMKYSENAYLGRDRFDRKHYVREQIMIYEKIRKRGLVHKT